MIDSESNLKKFAKIMERYPPLYFGYNSSILWETVASSVRLEIREECTVEELKCKWRIMRSKYVYYAKRLSRGKKLNKEEHYDLYDTLSFLYPYAAERHIDILKTPPPLPSNAFDICNEKRKSMLKTIDKNSIRTYTSKKETSAVGHHSVGEPDNLGQSTRSDDLEQSTRSGGLGQSTEECSTSIKTEALWDETEDPTSSNTSSKKYIIIYNSVTKSDHLVKKTRTGDFGQSSKSNDLGQTTKSDDLGQSTRSHDLRESTGPGDVELSTECSTAIKAEALWDLSEDSASSKTSSKKYVNNKDTSAFDHHSVSEQDNLGQSSRSDYLVQSAKSDCLGQISRSDDIELSAEVCSTAIKAEALSENPTSSDTSGDVKPMDSVNLIKSENFPDGMTESTTFNVQETEGNLDVQFFKSILPEISNCTPQEKRQFQMGVLKLIDEIEDNRK